MNDWVLGCVSVNDRYYFGLSVTVSIRLVRREMNGQKKFNLLSVGGVLLDFLLRVPEIISVFGCLGEKERRGTTRGTTET